MKNIYKKKKKILIKINNRKKIDIKYISLKDKFKYANKKYDATIIEKKQKDNIRDFLKFDENILNDNIGYIGNSAYILDFLIFSRKEKLQFHKE